MLICSRCYSRVTKMRDLYKCDNSECKQGKMYEQDFSNPTPDWVEDIMEQPADLRQVILASRVEALEQYLIYQNPKMAGDLEKVFRASLNNNLAKLQSIQAKREGIGGD